MKKNFDQSMQELENASPLNAAKIIQKMEMYDSKSAQQIIDEVYQEFATNKDKETNIIKPIFLSIADSLIQGTSFGRLAGRKGLTASRIIDDCENFSYQVTDQISDTDGYTEHVNNSEYVGNFGGGIKNNSKTNQEDTKLTEKIYKENFTRNLHEKDPYNRKKYENQNEMNKYRNKKIEEAGKNKNLEDEYTGKINITGKKNNYDKRHGEYSREFQAETDHIVPLATIQKQFKNNYALSDDDIKKIANDDSNFAITSGSLNAAKNDKSNKQFIEKMGNNLDSETKERMIKKANDAQESIEWSANKTVFNNITGKGHTDRIARKQACDAEEKRLGRTLTREERSNIDARLIKKKQQKILDSTMKNATTQSKDYAIGNTILFMIKPLYYEVKDIAINGMSHGVGVASVTDAFYIRFNRVKKYVIDNMLPFLKNNLIDFIKNLLSSFVEGIISLFTGIFKHVLKLIKEGIKLFMSSFKTLFGKESKSMTTAEKGDALIKIIGGSVLAIAGVGIEALLSKLAIGEPWSVIFSTFFSGIASTAFMILLDRVDLFSIKSAQRRNRIIEIFNARITDIDYAIETCNTQGIELLKKQQQGFVELNQVINIGFEENNINYITDGLYKMASFMHVDLPYSNTDEFAAYYDTHPRIAL
ncbi:hypothetical protein [Pectinatus sottacetonis]|uniref:hypothetical protein n=1 Tax=Pectinatus sottacetonis TaxID=1002795 RepID=UPI0018C5FF1C|nr:hypothetical protein [Pectinatus sottacetonis]